MKINEIFAIDDDTTYLKQVSKVIIQLGYNADIESNPTKAMEKIHKSSYDCILLDIKMPGIDGIDLLQQILNYDNSIPVIVVSGQSTINIAVEAMKLGAYDFVEKPVEKSVLEIPLRNACKLRELQQTNKSLLEEIEMSNQLIGVSSGIQSIREQIRIASGTDAKVLITGETGTGKELVAKAIHHQSSRRDHNYVKVNCAAIPSELLESELFGHKKGSFTGAFSDKVGKFKSADNGTLFLDEIGDMSLNLQAKILRALEENEIEVVGESKPRKVDVRIIAATNKDLHEEIKAGNFRQDLFHRLDLIRIHIPPLRKRKDDIRPIAQFYLDQFSQEYNKKILVFRERAFALLAIHEYPGNARELKNVIEKLVIYTEYDLIDVDDISKVFGNWNSNGDSKTTANQMDLKTAKMNFEREYIAKVLLRKKGRITETAKELGLDRSNLFKKMKQLGIDKTNLQ